jgi:flavin-dependent dehydrogenase
MQVIKTDIAIVGAGPGGSAAAIYASRRNLKSVIIEKDEFPRYHIGESLTGEAGKMLRNLGLGEYMVNHRHPWKHGVNVYGPAGDQTFRIPVMERIDSDTIRPAKTWQVRREDLDLRLLQQAQEAGSEYIAGRASDVIIENGGVRGVRVSTPGDKTVDVSCDVVIDASGPATFLNRVGVTGKKRRGKYSSQIAVFSQVEGAVRDDEKETDNTRIFYEQRNHWAWFIPLNDKTVSVGVVVPSSYYREQGLSMEEFFHKKVREINPELARRIANAPCTEPVRACSNYSYEIDNYVGNGFLCVGDAHRFVDPIFSFGVHLAIHEANMAVQAIVDHVGREKRMTDTSFREYGRVCDIGMDSVQELIDAFWNNPLAFTYVAHHKHKEDIIDLFAGRIYAEKPSKGLLALRKINEAHSQQSIDPSVATA